MTKSSLPKAPVDFTATQRPQAQALLREFGRHSVQAALLQHATMGTLRVVRGAIRDVPDGWVALAGTHQPKLRRNVDATGRIRG